MIAAQVGQYGVSVFTIGPGLVGTAMTEELGDHAPWTPPALAPQLVRVLASGRADRLSGRFIHAEHDDIEELIARAAAARLREGPLRGGGLLVPRVTRLI